MFKEIGIVILLFTIFYCILEVLRKWKLLVFEKVLVGSLTILLCVNIVYNIKYVFPSYDYENVSIGDCRENLFAYKSDSQFGWQILFPILQNRNVRICDERGTYNSFMEMYAGTVQYIELENDTMERIEKVSEWSLESINLSMFLSLDYVFPDYCYDDTKGFPILNVRFDDLKGSDELIAYVDENENLYLMSSNFLKLLEQGGE